MAQMHILHPKILCLIPLMDTTTKLNIRGFLPQGCARAVTETTLGRDGAHTIKPQLVP